MRFQLIDDSGWPVGQPFDDRSDAEYAMDALWCHLGVRARVVGVER